MLRPGIRRLLGLDVARKERFQQELEDELQLHLELRAEQLRKRGLGDDEANRGSLRRRLCRPGVRNDLVDPDIPRDLHGLREAVGDFQLVLPRARRQEHAVEVDLVGIEPELADAQERQRKC